MSASRLRTKSLVVFVGDTRNTVNDSASEYSKAVMGWSSNRLLMLWLALTDARAAGMVRGARSSEEVRDSIVANTESTNARDEIIRFKTNAT